MPCIVLIRVNRAINGLVLCIRRALHHKIKRYTKKFPGMHLEDKKNGTRIIVPNAAFLIKIMTSANQSDKSITQTNCQPNPCAPCTILWLLPFRYLSSLLF